MNQDIIDGFILSPEPDLTKYLSASTANLPAILSLEIKDHIRILEELAFNARCALVSPNGVPESLLRPVESFLAYWQEHFEPWFYPIAPFWKSRFEQAYQAFQMRTEILSRDLAEHIKTVAYGVKSIIETICTAPEEANQRYQIAISKADKRAWKKNLSQSEIAELIGCTDRTIREKRQKSKLWEESIQRDPEHTKKWKIKIGAIQQLRKEMNPSK